MLIEGISKIGKYHEINQDFYLCKPYKDGIILVVSDGMGSRSLSHYGSKCLCESIYDVISNFPSNFDKFSFKDVIYACHEEWKRRLSNVDVKQCYATMLVAVIKKNSIKAARLGDGFLSIYIDEEVFCLYDKKETYFANETDCMREELDQDKIEIRELEYEKFHGVLACTDGIEIGTMQETELISFTQEFVEEYSNKEREDAITEIRLWVSEWPGTDDKTLAFVIEGGK